MFRKSIIIMILFHLFCSTTLASQSANLYRNKDYTFSINFPKGWNIRDGQTPHTAAIAENGKGESIVIQVWQLPRKVSLEDFTNSDLSNYIKGTFQEFKDRYPNAVFHDSGITYISNEKATWLSVTYTIKHAFAMADVKTFMYQVFYNGLMYQIMCSSPTERFKQFETIFLTSIRSFIFEEAAWYKK